MYLQARGGASEAVGVGVGDGDGESGVNGAAGSSSTSGSHRGGRSSQSHRGRGKRGAGGGGSSGAAQRAVKRREHWASQLCTPEWMLTVPNDLNGAGSPVGAGEPIPRTHMPHCFVQASLVAGPGFRHARRLLASSLRTSFPERTTNGLGACLSSSVPAFVHANTFIPKAIP